MKNQDACSAPTSVHTYTHTHAPPAALCALLHSAVAVPAGHVALAVILSGVGCLVLGAAGAVLAVRSAVHQAKRRERERQQVCNE